MEDTHKLVIVRIQIDRVWRLSSHLYNGMSDSPDADDIW